ncbi:hypothetical protein BU202_01985 [Streptococcus cuniculi]|uniref:Uncharacterized protein n=1 Tax=Streptococcus cuniculi TaxID=1432788 RepID=A0A1Q8E9E8_9STRE|nr:hypothetical protein [Streptococcus cuniculi]OLF48411.1 hypothetical protein BU202_01985 [Streptococcus cuniculi]
MRNKGLLSATFEQSTKLVKKAEIMKYSNDLVTSMSFFKRLMLFLPILFILSLIYMIGVVLPLQIASADQTNLSMFTIRIISKIGLALSSWIEKLLILEGVLLIINLFPKANYAVQLMFGVLISIVLSLIGVLGILPLAIGLTVGAFGWIGFGLQLLVCIYLWKSLIISNIVQLKQRLYQGVPNGKDWGERLMIFIKKYGGILLLLAIVNRWTFNFGEMVKTRPDIFSFLYGWAFLLVASLMIFMMSMTLKNFVAAFYFFKYQKEYRQFFKVSNEQWYGKWRGKKMDKKKHKER